MYHKHFSKHFACNKRFSKTIKKVNNSTKPQKPTTIFESKRDVKREQGTLNIMNTYQSAGNLEF